MRLYNLKATRGDDSLVHQRIGITKLLPIMRILLQDGWTVVTRFDSEATHPRAVISPPMSHPWKAFPAVNKKRRKRRSNA